MWSYIKIACTSCIWWISLFSRPICLYITGGTWTLVKMIKTPFCQLIVHWISNTDSILDLFHGLKIKQCGCLDWVFPSRWKASILDILLCQLKHWYIGVKSLPNPVFWLHSLETGPISISWLFVRLHRWIIISNTRPFFLFADFQLCVCSTENRQVSRSQACCSTCHYFNTAGTGEEHNRGKFVNQSEQRLN